MEMWRGEDAGSIDRDAVLRLIYGAMFGSRLVLSAVERVRRL